MFSCTVKPVSEKPHQILMAREGQLFTVTLEPGEQWTVQISPEEGIALMGREEKDSEILIFKSLKAGEYIIKLSSALKTRILKVVVN